MAVALYVHLPFCASFCPYCDFPKVYHDPNRVLPYLEALFAEALQKAKGPYDTIYFGGGTPTLMAPELFDRTLSFFAAYLAKDGEFSIEANPETLTEEKIALLARYGINRVSIGVQSFESKYLALLKRHHDEAKVSEVVGLLKKYGIDNINLDLMFSLPGENVEEALADVKKAIALGPTHISAYSLIVEENTPFSRRGIVEQDSDEQAAQYEAIMDLLEEAGYRRYEVSNFALDGKRCRHNLHYWNDDDYDALGLGASGHVGNYRYKNTVDFAHYCAREYLGEEETLTQQEEIECYLLSCLRKIDGFALDDFKERFGRDFLTLKAEEVEKLKSRGLLEIDRGRVKASKDGLLLLDQILVTLF